MSHGQPCNHCGFEKSYPFLAYVHSTAFSLFFSNNPNSKPEKFIKKKEKRKKEKEKKKNMKLKLKLKLMKAKEQNPETEKNPNNNLGRI